MPYSTPMPDQDRQAINAHIEANDPSFEDFVLPGAPEYRTRPRNLVNLRQIGPRLWIGTSPSEGCKVVLKASTRKQAALKSVPWNDASDKHLSAEWQQGWYFDLCARQGANATMGAWLKCRWTDNDIRLERKMSASGIWQLVADAPEGDLIVPLDKDLDWIADHLALVEPTPVNEWCRRPAGTHVIGSRCAA